MQIYFVCKSLSNLILKLYFTHICFHPFLFCLEEDIFEWERKCSSVFPSLSAGRIHSWALDMTLWGTFCENMCEYVDKKSLLFRTTM